MLKFVTSKTLFVLCFVMGKHGNIFLQCILLICSMEISPTEIIIALSLWKDLTLLLLEKFAFNPLSARIFTVFEQFITGQSVTQRRMGREAPRYPPQYPGP